MTLKELRQESGKTCAEVAEELGVTVRAVYNYEKGIREINLSQIPKLSKLYDCTIEEIVNAGLVTIGQTE